MFIYGKIKTKKDKQQHFRKLQENFVILKNAKIKKIKNVLDKIIGIESEENIALTTEQRTAIISALENNVTIITGGPRNR